MVEKVSKELRVKRVTQGQPFYFIETLEKRSINSNPEARGVIGTLCILNYDPRIVGTAAPDQFKECYACGLWVDKRNITKDRYWGTPPELFCHNCRTKIRELFPDEEPEKQDTLDSWS
jgi:hypothetical protein